MEPVGINGDGGTLSKTCVRTDLFNSVGAPTRHWSKPIDWEVLSTGHETEQ